MARLFATVIVLFLGGSGAAALVTGNLWPVFMAMLALFFLTKVFSACDSSPPPEPVIPKPVYHRGRKDQRMPT